MAVQIQMRRDSAADWASNDPTLASGEFGFETDTGKIKIGDGSTAWTGLSYFAPGGAFTSRCSAYRSGTQAITTGTWTKVLVNAEDYDIGGEFDHSSNYRFQPDVTGYYHVSVGVQIQLLTTGDDAYAAIYKQGAIHKVTATVMGGNGTIYPVISCDMYLLDTNYIEVWTYHNHGSNINVGHATNHYTFMDVHRFA